MKFRIWNISWKRFGYADEYFINEKMEIFKQHPMDGELVLAEDCVIVWEDEYKGMDQD